MWSDSPTPTKKADAPARPLEQRKTSGELAGVARSSPEVSDVYLYDRSGLYCLIAMNQAAMTGP